MALKPKLKIRIGSRPSRLALAQASIVRDRIAAHVSADIEIVGIRTSGDKITSASLADIGGKGLFIKELEQALADRSIDVAVHSMKDLPAVLPGDFRVAAVLERENTADILVTRDGAALPALPFAPASPSDPGPRFAPPAFALTGDADSISNDGAMLVATYGIAATGTRELGFSDGNLALVRETASGGQVNYEVRYADYHDIGGVMFPYTVDATFPAAGSHVKFRFLRPIVNGDIPDSTFVLTPAPGATLMNLSIEGPGAFSNES